MSSPDAVDPNFFVGFFMGSTAKSRGGTTGEAPGPSQPVQLGPGEQISATLLISVILPNQLMG